MDANAPPTRITDPSLPAGRRREIDNIMKKARAQNSPTSSAIWEKKLLEVEAKDSNRWRHSGYKSMYLDGGSTSRSRSRSRSFSSTRRGGGGGGGSPSPPPPHRRGAGRSPRGRSPRSPPPRAARSPRSPPPRGRSPRSPPPARRAALSPPSGYRGRPRTPPSPRSKRCGRRSASASSMSSCSDDSCSVCSPKHRPGGRSRSRSYSPPPRPSGSNSGGRGKQGGAPPKPSSSRPRPPSPASPPPPRRMPRPMTPPVAKRMPMPRPGGGGASDDRPTDPRTRPPPPRPQVPVKKQTEKGGQATKPPMLARIKKEGAPRKKTRPGSPGNESSGSEDSGVSSAVPIVATTAMTLSERFGKIAQWSADRERRDIENMRITKTGSNMKVMVEEDEFLYGTPPRRYSISPVPQGHYPDELLSAGQSRLAAWDDVRVRYQYYKDLGYLRDLSLDDYVKWEEWWYKYQDWLANERHYEHWLATHSGGGGGGGGGGRRRKKRIPASQRLGN
ncbi:serine/arginine repetitive matrix protein 1 isoform X2 [Anthonomus grandis grandis]|nr:serine/arginine repetitive matrix protein 1 isoform X2 [Anthonomus grandis grandis]XP_050303215.1 serine/arginine repetitive matrix protein 1 isoform X2 [Anthonomus grandis grandis]XP_050303216.1 serine/arginine repetitive matrix protein 1 isoform X2 [Anthonomus grandis grandis]